MDPQVDGVVQEQKPTQKIKSKPCQLEGGEGLALS